MKVKYCCTGWKLFMPEIQAAEGWAWAHGHRYSEDFKPFKFCPWCGIKVIEEGNVTTAV